MKKILKLGVSFLVALAFILTTLTSVSAKPIDYGNNALRFESNGSLWQDNANIAWDISLIDYYTESIDQLSIYGYDMTNNILLTAAGYYETLTTEINFRKGFATFVSPTVDLMITFDTDSGTFEASGTRKDGDLRYTYTGPGTINGSITIDSVVYVVEGTVSGDFALHLELNHDIVK